MLAAENGFYYGYNFNNKIEYNKLMHIDDWQWKDAAYDIMKSYQEKTDGSFILNRDSSIRWFFKDVDTDFANKEAKELVAHLHTILENLPLSICYEKDYVEVKPAGLDKGSFTNKLLRTMERTKGPIDFVLCIGDNQSDECMFKIIKQYTNEKKLRNNTFCVTVGQKVSQADFYLNDQSEVIAILPEIVMSSIEVY